jgi:hypothetical protein
MRPDPAAVDQLSPALPTVIGMVFAAGLGSPTRALISRMPSM